jgi:hypothetical protein
VLEVLPGAGVRRGDCVFGNRGEVSLEVFLRCGMMVGGGMSSVESGARSLHLGGGAFFGAEDALPDEVLPGPARSRMSLNGLAE